MLSEEQQDPAQASLANLESYSNSWALQEGKVTPGYSERRPFSPAVRKGRCVDGDSCNSWMTPTPGHLPKQPSSSFLRQTNPPHPAGCRGAVKKREQQCFGSSAVDAAPLPCSRCCWLWQCSAGKDRWWKVHPKTLRSSNTSAESQKAAPLKSIPITLKPHQHSPRVMSRINQVSAD